MRYMILFSLAFSLHYTTVETVNILSATTEQVIENYYTVNEEPVNVLSATSENYYTVTDEPVNVLSVTSAKVCAEQTTSTQDQLFVQTINCTSEVVTVYTTEFFVLNSLMESTSALETTSTSALETTSTTVLETTSTSALETTSTTVFETTSTILIDGDLEGLPTDTPIELLPEINIEEISNSEVSEIRDNGVEFCNAVGLGDFIANGTQQQFQTCSLTVQGAIPAVDKMVSTIIISPDNNAVIKLGENFTITIKSINIEYGFFDDPASLYYISPQRLNNQGVIQGHNHVAIQKLLGPGEVPSAQNPLFFKGLNEVSLDGTLSTEVNGELFTETGEYRLCTSSASQGHQPVLGPVARRFFQDDCIRFTVVNV